MDLFSPLIQPSLPSNVHIPSLANFNGHRQSFVIKRRHMTFAEAEYERSQRILQLALLGPGDIIGLECYVCDLATHINTARCTAPCDLFYILKHNFVRLQKRHGTQGLGERLREMILPSLQAYPQRVSYLPLFTTLMKKQLAPPLTDEQQQQLYQNKKSWLLRLNHPGQSIRRIGSTGKNLPTNSLTNFQTASFLSQKTSFGNSATVQFVAKDHIRVDKLEDRLKQWHAQMGTDSKTQIRPLTRYVK